MSPYLVRGFVLSGRKMETRTLILILRYAILGTDPRRLLIFKYLQLVLAFITVQGDNYSLPEVTSALLLQPLALITCKFKPPFLPEYIPSILQIFTFFLGNK